MDRDSRLLHNAACYLNVRGGYRGTIGPPDDTIQHGAFVRRNTTAGTSSLHSYRQSPRILDTESTYVWPCLHCGRTLRSGDYERCG